MTNSVGRPQKRKDHVNIRFNIDKEIKKEFQRLCLDEEITMQDVLESYVHKLVKERKIQ